MNILTWVLKRLSLTRTMKWCKLREWISRTPTEAPVEEGAR